MHQVKILNIISFITYKKLHLHKIQVREANKMNENYHNTIFTTYYKSLVNFACYHVLQQDIAEDIVQEVLIYMWKNNVICDNELALRTYLYRSVLNRCRNYIRDSKTRKNHDKIICEEIDTTDNSILNSIISEEVYRQLLSALEYLPPQCRKIYEMLQDGMKPSEIAVKLNLAVETVKKQRKIAKKILQDKLGNTMILLTILGIINFLDE